MVAAAAAAVVLVDVSSCPRFAAQQISGFGRRWLVPRSNIRLDLRVVVCLLAHSCNSWECNPMSAWAAVWSAMRKLEKKTRAHGACKWVPNQLQSRSQCNVPLCRESGTTDLNRHLDHLAILSAWSVCSSPWSSWVGGGSQDDQVIMQSW